MEKIHHFLYYIFQFDKKRCKIERKKEAALQKTVRKNLQKRPKGENYGKREID